MQINNNKHLLEQWSMTEQQNDDACDKDRLSQLVWAILGMAVLLSTLYSSNA